MLDTLSRWPLSLAGSAAGTLAESHAPSLADLSGAPLPGVLRDMLLGLSAGWLAMLGAAGLLLLMLTLVIAPWLIARLPVNHFSIERRPPRTRGPARLLLLVLRNALAAIALLLGLVMLVAPGPGVVMLVIALSLADFRGRHRLVQRLVSYPAVFASLNWVRHRHAKPAFEYPPGGRAAASTRMELGWVPMLLAGAFALAPTPPVQAQSSTTESPGTSDAVDPANGTPVPRAPSADSVAEELARAAERLERLDRALAASRAEREALAARLQDTTSRAAERSARVEGLSGDIERYATTLAELERQVDDERTAQAGRRERLADDLRRLQRVQGPGPLAVLLQHEDPAGAERLSVWAGYALRARRRAIVEQAGQLVRLDAARARALKDRNWLEHLKRKATGQRDQRLDERRASRDAVRTIDSRITETTRSVATLRADSERLEGVLEALRVEERGGSGYFAAGKGGWPMPVDGRVDARFGEAKSVGRLAWNGLFIRAEPGRPVSTIADGELVYADWLTGFGLLAIVDHGDGWMSLYGGNRELTVPVGTWVESGATIATSGNSSGQTNAGLYFELRQDARPVDPEPWLSGMG